MPDHPVGGPTDYLAAERTFLAWIRTALALMGFGFVVARFGLFLQALQIGQLTPRVASYGISFWFGTVLIVLGVIVNVTSAWRYLHLTRELERGGSSYTRPSSMAIAVAVILAMLGLAMAFYLLSVREHSGPLDSAEVNPVTAAPANGIVAIPSHRSVDETVAKLQGILQAKGVKVFAVVDHSGGAQDVGLTMRPTKLVIFGNPAAGTPLMLASPSIAIDLPLKLLVSEDADGKVWISYNTPAYLQARHNLPQALVPTLAGVEALAAKAAE
jgi:uncharacterized protein (DUF302 family)/uncharacterized membrane protein YidH (DUF202 family)